jgi:hypothetical protein
MNYFNNFLTEKDIEDSIITDRNFLIFKEKNLISDNYKEEIVVNIINQLSIDLKYIHDNIIYNIDIKFSYDFKNLEFSININFILNNVILDDKLFDVAILYFDKYEKILLDNNIYDLAIDFNVVTANEYVKVITTYSTEDKIDG